MDDKMKNSIEKIHEYTREELIDKLTNEATNNIYKLSINDNYIVISALQEFSQNNSFLSNKLDEIVEEEEKYINIVKENNSLVYLYADKIDKLNEEFRSVEIMKENIDGSVFTIEKEYSISGNGEYSKFDGNFLLIYKRTFYRFNDDTCTISCNLGFKPSSDNESAHSSTNTNLTNSLAVSSTAHKSTSSVESPSTTTRSEQNAQQEAEAETQEASTSQSRTDNSSATNSYA